MSCLILGEYSFILPYTPFITPEVPWLFSERHCPLKKLVLYSDYFQRQPFLHSMTMVIWQKITITLAIWLMKTMELAIWQMQTMPLAIWQMKSLWSSFLRLRLKSLHTKIKKIQLVSRSERQTKLMKMRAPY